MLFIILAIYNEIFCRNVGLSHTQKVLKSRIIILRYMTIKYLSSII